VDGHNVEGDCGEDDAGVAWIGSSRLVCGVSVLDEPMRFGTNRKMFSFLLPIKFGRVLS
jgi:hypothetical protein